MCYLYVKSYWYILNGIYPSLTESGRCQHTFRWSFGQGEPLGSSTKDVLDKNYTKIHRIMPNEIYWLGVIHKWVWLGFLSWQRNYHIKLRHFWSRSVFFYVATLFSIEMKMDQQCEALYGRAALVCQKSIFFSAQLKERPFMIALHSHHGTQHSPSCSWSSWRWQPTASSRPALPGWCQTCTSCIHPGMILKCVRCMIHIPSTFLQMSCANPGFLAV